MGWQKFTILYIGKEEKLIWDFTKMLVQEIAFLNRNTVGKGFDIKNGLSCFTSFEFFYRIARIKINPHICINFQYENVKEICYSHCARILYIKVLLYFYGGKHSPPQLTIYFST